MIYAGLLALIWLSGKIQSVIADKKLPEKYLPYLFAIIFFGPVVFNMICLHPYQNTFFNILAGTGEKLDKNFEQEYWGLSCKESLEYLTNSIPEGEIKIFASGEPVGFNLSILPENDRNRIKSVSFDQADYFVYHHRFENAKQQFYEKVWPFTNELYTVKVNDIVVSGVYSMKDRH
jgi:hypothetical protein